MPTEQPVRDRREKWGLYAKIVQYAAAEARWLPTTEDETEKRSAELPLSGHSGLGTKRRGRKRILNSDGYTYIHLSTLSV